SSADLVELDSQQRKLAFNQRTGACSKSNTRGPRTTTRILATHIGLIFSQPSQKPSSARIFAHWISKSWPKSKTRSTRLPLGSLAMTLVSSASRKGLTASTDLCTHIVLKQFAGFVLSGSSQKTSAVCVRPMMVRRLDSFFVSLPKRVTTCTHTCT